MAHNCTPPPVTRYEYLWICGCGAEWITIDGIDWLRLGEPTPIRDDIPWRTL